MSAFSYSNLKFSLINYQSIRWYPWRLRWTAHHNIPSRCLDGRLSAEKPLLHDRRCHIRPQIGWVLNQQQRRWHQARQHVLSVPKSSDLKTYLRKSVECGHRVDLCCNDLFGCYFETSGLSSLFREKFMFGSIEWWRVRIFNFQITEGY